MDKLANHSWLFLGALCLLASQGCEESGLKMAEGGKAKGRVLTVDASGDAGYHVSMDLDDDDRPHMVYYDKKHQVLRYVRHSQAGFSSEVVDDTCKRCLFATIRVTGDFEPHIAYYSDLTQTLTYAYRRDGKWKREGIEWGQGTGMGARLLLDENNQLHALYYSGDGFLKHGWRVKNKASLEPAPLKKRRKGKDGKPLPVPEQPEGIWGNERVDKAHGSEKVSISFVKQPNGLLAASYFSWSGLNSELRLAIQADDKSWKTEVVAHANNPGKSSALFFNRQGEPQVIFREAKKDRLSLAQMSVEGWKVQPLLPKAYNLSLAVDGTHNLLVAYERMSGRDPRKGHLRMAWRKEWNWTEFQIDDTAGSGSFLSAGLTASGNPVIAFFEEKGKSLKLFIGE